ACCAGRLASSRITRRSSPSTRRGRSTPRVRPAMPSPRPVGDDGVGQANLVVMTPSGRQEALHALLERLDASLDGLSSTDAALRLREHGGNEMSTVPLARKLLDVLRSILSPLVAILLVA